MHFLLVFFLAAPLLATTEKIEEAPSIRMAMGLVSNTATIFPSVNIQELVWPSVALGVSGLYTQGSDHGANASLFVALATATFYADEETWNLELGVGPGWFSSSQRGAGVFLGDENATLWVAALTLGHRFSLGTSGFIDAKMGGLYIETPSSEFVDVLYTSLKPMASVYLGLKL